MNSTIKNQLILSGVGNEVIEKLKIYVDLLTQWNKAINLVSPTTLPYIWERHILDSAQLWPIISQHANKGSRIIDLGSGGGLPAMVLAIMGADHVTMVESDQRKCVFLQEASRETKLTNVTIVNSRIENVQNLKAPIITARALAPLLDLTAWASSLVESDGVMIFPKGQDWQEEVDSLNEHFNDDFLGKIETFTSVTDDTARIILIHTT